MLALQDLVRKNAEFQHKGMDYFNEQEALVKALVHINSVVGKQDGEKRLCQFLETWLKDNIGESLDIFHVPSGDGNRESLVALLKAPVNTKETILLLGHIDTVEIDDFGALIDLALDPDALEQEFLKLADKGQLKDEKFVKDLKSGEYMFGRGSLDMKSGLAANLQTLKYFANHRDAQKFNLLLVCECDEEGDSKGMLSAMPFVKQLCEEKCLSVSYAICSDFSEEPAVYLGTIGKFLPCYVAFGKEAHVGDALSSVDPNLIISHVVCNVDYNPNFADENLGEKTPPPVSLKQADTKENYSVQTAGCAYAYFNWFSYKRGPEEVLSLALDAGKKAMKETLDKLPKLYKERVYAIKSYAEALGESLGAPPPGSDLRLWWIDEAKRLRSFDKDADPVLLVFLSGQSYAPITVEPESKLGKAAASLGIKLKNYYPYISDASFIGMLGDVPLVNLGSYGFEGHTPRERVNKKYTFDTLPKLQIRLVEELGK